MIARALRQIQYENHLQTLRSLGLPIQAFTVLDADGSCVWSNRHDKESDKRMHQALQLLHRSTSAADKCDRFVYTDLPAGSQAFATYVDDELEGRLLAVVFITRTAARLDQDGIKRVELAALAVGANMLSEFQLNKELEAMASELTDRYEELNLVFQGDHSSQNMLFGFESLRRIIKDTIEFLGIGMAALMLPSKEIEFYDLDNDVSVAKAPELLASLKGRQFEQLQSRAEAIVVNNVHDRVRVGLPADLHCKLMVIPVQGGTTEIVGMLVVANDMKRDDFTNSDRNLGNVMATKISKVLQANFDALTGLENSHSFEWSVGQSLLQARSRGLKHAILHVDIDRTNIVNDISGRSAGDELVRLVAGVLADSVRAHDCVARLSGDEFGILLETCSLDSAASLAEKISQRVESTDFCWEGTMHPLSVCIGVAPITADSESVTSILSSVSVARDAAKDRGRNRVQVYEQNDIDLLRRRGEFEWVGKIQAALRDERFELYAQSINRLSSNDELPHFELLVRMLDDRGALVPPGKFIPAAEHYHLMPSLDRWVVGKAVDRLLAATELCGSPPMQLSINLSGQSLSDEQVKKFVCEQLDRLGPFAKHLCFEITESAAIANIDDALDLIATAKAYGCKFSLDDFGSGLSSFAYLQRFDVDFLKIDGSFVRRADTDRVAASMVSAINQVGHVIGLQTIAEFVENAAILNELETIGVDYAQGNHFGRPQPLGELLNQLIHIRSAAIG